MNIQALNKMEQTHSLFKRIVAPLKNHMGLDFGYMKVFLEGSYYYRIMENLDCNKVLIKNIEKGKIFSDRNVTNYFDSSYNFTLWPKTPKHKAMQICYEHNVWEGITISKISKHQVDLYWFNTTIQRIDWHEFFIRNKPLLIEFISFFNKHKKLLSINDSIVKNELFEFKQGFDISIPESEYIKNESDNIRKFIKDINLSNFFNDTGNPSVNLSSRELEVFSYICRGYTAKLIANILNISIRTVECYIEKIKHKTNLRYKSDFVRFGELFNFKLRK